MITGIHCILPYDQKVIQLLYKQVYVQLLKVQLL